MSNMTNMPTITNHDSDIEKNHEEAPSSELGALNHVRYWWKRAVQEPAQQGAHHVEESWKQLSVSMQQQSQKISEEKIRPNLQKAYGSIQNLQQQTAVSLQQAGKHTQEQWQKLSRETSQKAQEIGEHAQQQSRSISIATKAAAVTAINQVQTNLQKIGEPPVIVLQEDPGEPTAASTTHLVVKEPESDAFVTTANFHVVQAVAAFGMLSALVSSYMVVNRLVDLACLSLLLVSPIVMLQKCKLQSLGTMRKQQNQLRETTNRLARENALLARSLDTLHQRQESLQGVEARLDKTVKALGAHSAESLVQLVYRHQQLVQEMQQKLQARITQQVVTTLLHSDRDKDFSLKHSEVLLLQYQLSKIPGLKFNAKRFQNTIANEQGEMNMADVCKLSHCLTDPTVPEEERIFTLDDLSVLAQQELGKVSS